MTPERVPLLALSLLLALGAVVVLAMPPPLHWGRFGAAHPMSARSQRSFAWLLAVAAVAFGAHAFELRDLGSAAGVVAAPSVAWLAVCAWRDGRRPSS